MGVFVLGVIALVTVALHWHPASQVILLPDADGNTGVVLVRTETTEQALGSAYTSAGVDRKGDITLRAEDAAQVVQRHAATLAARPRAPVSFILFFDFGSAVDITPAFKPVLEELLAALASYPAPEITVIGHTDRVGTLEFNDRLSLERAQTVRDLLLQAGVKVEQIEVAGRGEREPRVPTPDEQPEEQNRRVEINLR